MASLKYPSLPIDIKRLFVKSLKRTYPTLKLNFIPVAPPINQPSLFLAAPHIKTADDNTFVFCGLWLVFFGKGYTPQREPKKLKAFREMQEAHHFKVAVVRSVKEATDVLNMYCF